MLKEFFSFALSIPKIGKKNGLTHIQKAGDVIVSVDDNIEIISLMYGGVDLFPVMETIDGASDYFYRAIDKEMENRRYASDIEEENEAYNY